MSQETKVTMKAGTLTIEQALHQAVTHHQAGQVQDAERCYRAILQVQPNHPEANHNLGVLAVQMKQPIAGLPHFMTALENDPTRKQYWLSYIDALIQADMSEAARQVLALGRQQGLQGDEIEALAARLEAGAQPPDTEDNHVPKESPPISPAIPQQENSPSAQEINALAALFNGGRYLEAAALAQTMTIRFPLHGFGWKVLGAAFKQIGRTADALAPMQNAATLSPNDAEAHFNLGNILKNLERLDEAAVSYLRALEINPGFSESHFNLGNAFKALGRLDEAKANYCRALEIKPDDAEAHYNLGNTLRDMGGLDEAKSCYRRALEINPDYAEAHSNLGNILQDLGRLDEAEACYRQALLINPDYAEAHYNLGNILNDAGRLDEACYRRALEIKPGYAEAYNNLGVTLKNLGRLDEAEAGYRRALEIKADFAEAYNNLGNILQERGCLNEAEASCRRALEIKPDFADGYNNLGSTLRELGRLGEAESCCRRALEIKSDNAEAYSNLGSALKDLGRLDEAEACYRRALEIKPDLAEAHSNLLFLYSYHGLIDPYAYLVQARNWEQACLSEQARQSARHRTFQRLPLAGRRLKVGYVSGDYRQHSVSYFVEQLFAHHDTARIELFAYSTQSQCDAVTERLQALVEHWVSLDGVSNASIRERIEADGIDVLIDLSGHTKHHRLRSFAGRAAPVQAHYLGYFASTGLTEMDYWIGDEILTPAETDSYFSERVWRLPRIWVSYDGKTDAPAPDWRPSRDGVVWLGSFNNLGKLTPATLALWAKVLHALPEGKLLLKTKGLSNIDNRRRILDALSDHGILPDRIELQDSTATSSWSVHMAYYDRLDIALDPVGGVGGGTTTCDALWMGVPVISLEGDRMASRMTASMLNAIGHPEWIARIEKEYIEKAVALAHDVEQRKALRSCQRNRVASSPLCDAHGLTLALENAYFEMFERWFDQRN